MCVTPATTPCAPYACNAGACRTTCTTATDCAGPPYVCTGTTCGTATNVTVQVAMREIAPTNPAVSVDFKLFNNGTTPIPLSEMTLRYWYTIDSAQAQTAFIDYAAVGNGNVPLSFMAVSPAKATADFYLQVGFAAAAGSLAAGANTSDIQARFNKNDFSPYNEANDYSYTGSLSFMAPTTVTAYRLGVLVYGTEPP
jgi:endoglucanase